MRRWFLGMMFAVVPSVASAQQEHSLAVSHFDRGLAAMKSGDFATGCPALAESYRLDKRPGTLFTLADCEASWGKVASALAHFNDYMEWYERMPPEQKAVQRGRQDIVPERQRDLKRRLPMVTVKPGTVETTVEMDGTILGPGSMGVQLPIDPGAHELVVKAKGYEPNVTKFEIAEKEQKEFAADPGNPLPEAPPENVFWTTPRKIAVGAAGVGVVGLGVGTIFGLVTMGHKGTIQDNCHDTACNPEGKSAADASKTSGLISTVGFAVAGAAIAAAAVLWITAPKASSSKGSSRGTGSAFERPFLLTW